MFVDDDGKVFVGEKDTGFVLTQKDGFEFLKKGKSEVRLPHLGCGTYKINVDSLAAAIEGFGK